MVMMKERRTEPRGKCVASLTDVMKKINLNGIYFISLIKADFDVPCCKIHWLSSTDVYDEKFDFYEWFGVFFLLFANLVVTITIKLRMPC